MTIENSNILRIAVTGPESTGKSWLTKELASHYNTVYVPEFARKYLNERGGKYDFEDIVSIAKGQKKSEEQLIKKANGLIFADTESIVAKVWSDVVFGKCDRWILDDINNNPYKLYLLCYPDLPWEPDPLRENPDNREELYEVYKQELESRHLTYEIIKGMGEKRLLNAIKAIDNLLFSK